MMLKAVNRSENEGVRTACNTIVAKLQATVTRHKAAFPQLFAVDRFLDVTLPGTDRAGDHLSRLEELCAFLNGLGTGSYVIRHLHHNLCADVEAVKNGAFVPNPEETYLILPR